MREAMIEGSNKPLISETIRRDKVITHVTYLSDDYLTDWLPLLYD
jgi:hypothetical protein